MTSLVGWSPYKVGGVVLFCIMQFAEPVRDHGDGMGNDSSSSVCFKRNASSRSMRQFAFAKPFIREAWRIMSHCRLPVFQFHSAKSIAHYCRGDEAYPNGQTNLYFYWATAT